MGEGDAIANSSPMKPPFSHLSALLAAVFLFVADLMTKLWIESAFRLGETVPVIDGFFSLVYIKNRGSAFGFLSQVEGNWISYGFTAIAAVAIGVIIYIYRTLPKEDVVSRVSFILIGSGAFGNLVDRFRTGAVTDFLLFYIGQWSWPAFNVADSCITVGVVILGYTIIFKPQSAN
jgi:signal peptidase II